MRRVIWLGATLVLLATTLGVTAWSDFKDLGHQREWDVVAAQAAEAELAGIRVGVREARAAVVDAKPDRAFLFVRFNLQGSPEAAKSWIDCSASLQGAGGETWLPLYDYRIRGAVKILASDGKDNGNCNPGAVSGTGPVTFDQIYRLPTAALDNLTLHVSGYGTRPSALAFKLKPTIRTFKSE
ncbi:hypothetical protein [Mesorhizobium sp. 1M-11]|uniref:hypothetical protein n=1 Tax=Mesorhizobium sp. 1M-11 TaxID=1529006 RepID=UPI000A9C1A12|nr:hypothetical protein [Mesorhizobium sp. 1M-11]